MPSDNNENSRWIKVKKSLAKGYQSAKEKLEELKAEYGEKKEKSSDLQYGQFSDHSHINNPILIKKECPVCSFPIPDELIPSLENKEKIVCEHCGSIIKI